jgi:hypothetical protein
MSILKTYVTDSNTKFSGHTAVTNKTQVIESKGGNAKQFSKVAPSKPKISQSK